MLTKDQKKYLEKIPLYKKVRINPFNPDAIKTAKAIIVSINDLYANLEVEHMGASALGISGQNELDIYAFSQPKDFNSYLPGLAKLFGKPLHKHKTFIEWKFKKNGFNVEFYLTRQDSDSMKKQIIVFETLKNNKELLKEYEELKAGMNGKSLRNYQRKKYEFYNNIWWKDHLKIERDWS